MGVDKGVDRTPQNTSGFCWFGFFRFVVGLLFVFWVFFLGGGGVGMLFFFFFFLTICNVNVL